MFRGLTLKTIYFLINIIYKIVGNFLSVELPRPHIIMIKLRSCFNYNTNITKISDITKFLPIFSKKNYFL